MKSVILYFVKKPTTFPLNRALSIDFYIESGCNSGYVILYDGDSASDPRIGIECTYSPGCKETSSNNLLVTFTSYDLYQYRGFSAKFYVGGQYE